MCYMGAHWRIAPYKEQYKMSCLLSNTIEQSVSGGDAALCQITLTISSNRDSNFALSAHAHALRAFDYSHIRKHVDAISVVDD